MNGLLPWVPTIIACVAVAVAWGRFSTQMELGAVANKELKDEVRKLGDAVNALNTRVEVIDALRASSPGRGLP